MPEYEITITKEQGDLIIKAIEAYEFATADVMTVQECYERQERIIRPIYDQMPDEWF